MSAVQQQITTAPLIALHNIQVRIDERDILKNVDFELHAREIVTLIGPNGAGKSTLIKVLLGIVKPNAGKLVNARKLTFSYVPQKFNPSHSLPLRVKDLLALEKCPDAIKAEIIRDTGIAKLQDSKVQQLSGGERQRVLLARALYVNLMFWYWMSRCKDSTFSPKPNCMTMCAACLPNMAVQC